MPMGSHKKVESILVSLCYSVCVGDIQCLNWPQRGHDRSPKGTEGEEYVLI